jgi:hypothetical protein
MFFNSSNVKFGDLGSFSVPIVLMCSHLNKLHGNTFSVRYLRGLYLLVPMFPCISQIIDISERGERGR